MSETPPSELVRIPPGANAIIDGIVSDATDIIRARDAVRHRIGEYEFREPDYRQILTWAKAAGMTPEGLVERMQRCGLEVSDGVLIDIDVGRNLFTGIGLDFSHVLHLEKLDCRDNHLTKLDLAKVPYLRSSGAEIIISPSLICRRYHIWRNSIMRETPSPNSICRRCRI